MGKTPPLYIVHFAVCDDMLHMASSAGGSGGCEAWADQVACAHLVFVFDIYLYADTVYEITFSTSQLPLCQLQLYLSSADLLTDLQRPSKIQLGPHLPHFCLISYDIISYCKGSRLNILPASSSTRVDMDGHGWT